VPLVAADTADAYRDVEDVFLPVGVAVFVLVAGTILLLVWRGRRRAEPGRRTENNALEAVYVAVLAVVAGLLVAVSFSAEDRVGAAEPRPALKVHVVAAKWRWRFEYPAQQVVVQGTEARVPTLVVPARTKVEFDGDSLDVIHAFWVPAMRFQRQLIPGRPTHFTLTFPAAGFLSSSRCSFFCGLRHQDMRFGVQVMEPARFRAWASAHRGAA
jgi:cytochrome c oxidase subunit II